MTEPYTAGPDGEKDWVAYSTMTDEDAIAFAKMAIDSNHQLLCHCNGDAAADQLLRVYEAARDASDNPEKMALRPVMIHAQTARTDQYEKMAEIGMIPVDLRLPRLVLGRRPTCATVGSAARPAA